MMPDDREPLEVAIRRRAATNPDVPDAPRPFDVMIGRLDRLLSELLAAADREDLDDVDRQTIRHHADDLRSVADAVVARVGGPRR